MAIARTIEEAETFKNNVFEAIQKEFGYLIDVYGFQVEETTLRSSAYIVIFKNNSLSIKVDIWFDIRDESIFINTYVKENDASYREVHFFDFVPEQSVDFNIFDYIKVEYIDDETYPEMFIRVAEKLALCAELYKQCVDKYLNGEKFPVVKRAGVSIASFLLPEKFK